MNLHSTSCGLNTAHVVVVGGLDPSGGAGILRDHLTILQHGAYCTAIGTAWTRQDHKAIQSIEPREPRQVQAAIEDALRHRPTAIKIGMVANTEMIEAVLTALIPFEGPIVFDPVMAASNGSPLYWGNREALWTLAKRATLVTPNLMEAGIFLNESLRTVEAAQLGAHQLFKAGLRAVLLKGGHLQGDAVDFLVTQQGERRFVLPRIPGPSPRGTGCALASTIAVGLSQDQSLDEAISFAKSWLTERIAQAVPVDETWHLK